MDKIDRVEAEELYGGEDDPDQYVVLSFDPGGTTGWGLIGVHPDAVASGDPEIRILDNVEFWAAGQFTGPEWEQGDAMVSLAAAWPAARIVTEQFVLRSSVKSSDITALDRMNSVLGWAIRPRYYVLQQPSLAMSTITDARLKAAGMWVPGQEHARDALKHALTFLRRQRDRQIKAVAVVAASAARRTS
jgi:hypothetical protein